MFAKKEVWRFIQKKRWQTSGYFWVKLLGQFCARLGPGFCGCVLMNGRNHMYVYIYLHDMYIIYNCISIHMYIYIYVFTYTGVFSYLSTLCVPRDGWNYSQDLKPYFIMISTYKRQLHETYLCRNKTAREKSRQYKHKSSHLPNIKH